MVCFGLRVFVVVALGKTGGAMVKETILSNAQRLVNAIKKRLKK